jgi:LmbE family N-acetylglucosaminyl deacetylase
LIILIENQDVPFKELIMKNLYFELLLKRIKVRYFYLISLSLFSLYTVCGNSQGKPQKCIMVFGAHADDVELLAGGTFAKYISNGYKGIYVCVINNTAGCAIESVGGGTRRPEGKGLLFSVSNSPLTYPADAQETMQIRQEECRNAAAVFNAIPVFLNYSQPEIYLGRKVIIYGTEEYLKFNPPGRKQINLATRYSEDVDIVVELLKKYQPEIIITHTLGGEKLDHEGTAYMMYLAFKKAKEQSIPVGKLWMNLNGWLIDNPAVINGRGKPDIQVDVKDYLNIKYEALNKHVSQNGGFGRDYAMNTERQPREVIEEFITVIEDLK